MKFQIYDTHVEAWVRGIYANYYKLDMPGMYGWVADFYQPALSSVPLREPGLLETRGPEILEWVETYAKGRVIFFPTKNNNMLFEFKEDALMFKLKFGGQE